MRDLFVRQQRSRGRLRTRPGFGSRCGPVIRLVALSLALAGPAARAQEPPPPPESTRQSPAEIIDESATAERAPRDPIDSIFAPLALPAPDDFRSADGSPGPAYWQQRADYTIRVALVDDRIEGTETIRYTNNSPEALSSLWVQLDQNLFRKDSYGAERAEEGQRHGGFFDDAGFDISGMKVDQDGETYAVEHRVEDTMMEVFLPEPLAAGGGELELTVDFAFEIPENGADRMGRIKMGKGTIFQLAQWYPRMFVYDDVNGWNQKPFLGQGEWYLEFGDFDVEITVPREMIVVATGELLNANDVLGYETWQRYEEASTSAEIVTIISKEEVGDETTRPRGEGPVTWKYRAANVRDFSWAASRSFIWDMTSWEGVRIMSVYPEEGLGQPGYAGWERSTEYLRHSVEHYSEKWFQYPYPVAINVAGLALGMEYPMIVFCAYQAGGPFLFAVTDHEIGHTWFPMIVGSDERSYAWMDEGFNTFINYYSGVAWNGDPVLAGQMEPGQIASTMKTPVGEVTLMTPPDSMSETDIGFLAYNKPGAVLRMLREVVLGPDVFDDAFNEYIRRWAYKHPQPADFFRIMESVSGEDLDWFFRGWIYSNGILDQAVAGVQSHEGVTTITIENRGQLVMPLEVRVVYRDGSEETHELPVDIWRDSATWTTQVEDRPVRHVQIDPNGWLPDANRANNVWGRGVVGRRSS